MKLKLINSSCHHWCRLIESNIFLRSCPAQAFSSRSSYALLFHVFHCFDLLAWPLWVFESNPWGWMWAENISVPLPSWHLALWNFFCFLCHSLAHLALHGIKGPGDSRSTPGHRMKWGEAQDEKYEKTTKLSGWGQGPSIEDPKGAAHWEKRDGKGGATRGQSQAWARSSGAGQHVAPKMNCFDSFWNWPPAAFLKSCYPNNMQI